LRETNKGRVVNIRLRRIKNGNMFFLRRGRSEKNSTDKKIPENQVDLGKKP